jgi:hypothetical protein
MVRSVGAHTQIDHVPQGVPALKSRLKHLNLVVCLSHFGIVAGHIIQLAVLSLSLFWVMITVKNVWIVANASHIVLMVKSQLMIDYIRHTS